MISGFYSKLRSYSECDIHFRRRKGTTRAMVDAGLLPSSRGSKRRYVTILVEPHDAARAYGCEVTA